MKTQHTPGKWEFNNEALDEMHVEVQRKDGSWKHICHVYTEGHNPPRYDEAEANAKLIAAAPDLLACLQKLDAAGALALHTGDNGLHNFVQLMLMNTKEAIKKATL